MCMLLYVFTHVYFVIMVLRCFFLSKFSSSSKRLSVRQGNLCVILRNYHTIICAILECQRRIVRALRGLALVFVAPFVISERYDTQRLLSTVKKQENEKRC